MLTVSQSHLSHLNKLINTQHKLLKLRLNSDDREQLTDLFIEFQQINSKFSALYTNLQLGTIVLEDKISQQQKQKQMYAQMETIQGLLKNIQIEKQNLEQSVDIYRKQSAQQTNTISKLTAELNKLSTEKLSDKQKIKEYKEKIKELKQIQETAKMYKKQVKIYKQKSDTLEEKCRLLEQIQRKKEQDIGDELDKELQELQNEIQE